MQNEPSTESGGSLPMNQEKLTKHDVSSRQRERETALPTASGAQAATAVRDAAVSLEGMTEEQRRANKLQVERNLAGLQERVHKYNAYLPSLGARAARRKAKLGPNDILMWNYITAQHRAMDAKAVAAMRQRTEDKAAMEVLRDQHAQVHTEVAEMEARKKAAPEGTAQAAPDA